MSMEQCYCRYKDLVCFVRFFHDELIIYGSHKPLKETLDEQRIHCDDIGSESDRDDTISIDLSLK